MKQIPVFYTPKMVALDSTERRDVESQPVCGLLLRPTVGAPQLDHSPAEIAHHTVRMLHASNVPCLDSAETEGKYTRLGWSNTVSNTTMAATLMGNFDDRARAIAPGSADGAQKRPS